MEGKRDWGGRRYGNIDALSRCFDLLGRRHSRICRVGIHHDPPANTRIAKTLDRATLAIPPKSARRSQNVAVGTRDSSEAEEIRGKGQKLLSASGH
jgi:hypothetical protein